MFIYPMNEILSHSSVTLIDYDERLNKEPVLFYDTYVEVEDYVDEWEGIDEDDFMEDDD